LLHLNAPSIAHLELTQKDRRMAGEGQGPGPSVPPKKRKGLQRLLRGKGGLPGLHRASVDPIRRAALLNESQRNLNVPAAVRGGGAPAPACRLTSPSDAFHSYARLAAMLL
jgi:hypothetical protein